MEIPFILVTLVGVIKYVKGSMKSIQITLLKVGIYFSEVCKAYIQ